MRANYGFALREVAGEQVLMPTGENISKFKGALILSEVAAFAWQKLSEHPEGLDIKEIASLICDAYDVDASTAEKDIAEASEELRKYGAIQY